MCKNYKECPYRKEFYSGDSWMTYMACILESEGRDFKECNPGSSYCKYIACNETPVKYDEDNQE